jgi:hypothetical protein
MSIATMIITTAWHMYISKFFNVLMKYTMLSHGGSYDIIETSSQVIGDVSINLAEQ